MSELLQDLQFGWRMLTKNRGFTLVALAILGIGIGANTAIFSFFNAVLLKPLPYPEPDRIMFVMEKGPGGWRNAISTLNFLDWQRDNKVFTHLAAITGGTANLTGTGEPQQLLGVRVSAGFFDVFGEKMALGRNFSPEEDQYGNDRVVIITHGFWQSHFGGRDDVLGATLQLDGHPHVVIGVLGATSSYARGLNQIWRPIAFAPENMTRDFHWFSALGRLKPGVSLQEARTDMEAIAGRIAHDFPAIKKGWSVSIEPYADLLRNENLRRSLYVLSGAVGLVLLMVCANLANLTIARGLGREREISVRAALGASRGRLMRQLLTESVLLCLCGGALGLAMGYAMMRMLKAVLPPTALVPEFNVTLDPSVLLFALGVSLLTGVLCGIFPALQASRIDLAHAMKQGSSGAGVSRARQRLRVGLVITQIGLAFVLLTGAGLLVRTLGRLEGVDIGVDSTNVITAGLPIPMQDYPTAEGLVQYRRQILEAVSAVPGVREVALTSAVPLQGWGYGMPFSIAGQEVKDRASRRGAFFKIVTPSYFPALGIKLRQGRFLAETDRRGAPPVIVINESMVKKYFPNQEPLGQRLLVEEIFHHKTALGPEIAWEIVGVIADERVDSLDAKEQSSGMYVNFEQSPAGGAALLVRANMDPVSLWPSVRRAVLAVNKNQPLVREETLDQIKWRILGDSRLRTRLLLILASVALVLAAIGIYGVVAYHVQQRTNELSIRAALGARPIDLLNLILRWGMLTVAAGLLVGAAGFFGLGRLLASMLYGVGQFDLPTLCLVAALLAAVALLACYIPARRAMNVQPARALRFE